MDPYGKDEKLQKLIKEVKKNKGSGRHPAFDDKNEPDQARYVRRLLKGYKHFIFSIYSLFVLLVYFS